MNPSKTDGRPRAEREWIVVGGTRVLFGPVIARGDVLRWMGDASGGWMERWDGSAWAKGGSVLTLVGGRRRGTGAVAQTAQPRALLLRGGLRSI